MCKAPAEPNLFPSSRSSSTVVFESSAAASIASCAGSTSRELLRSSFAGEAFLRIPVDEDWSSDVSAKGREGERERERRERERYTGRDTHAPTYPGTQH